METTVDKSPRWMRAIQIGLGALAIIFSIIALVLPGLTILSLVILLAITLIVTGIEKIISGLFILHKSRLLTVGLGILTIIIAGIALAYPILAALVVIWLLGFSLMVDGFSRIADGVTNKSNKKWIRGLTIGVGVLSVIIAFMIIGSPAFGAIFASILISIALLIVGIEMLTTGISGHKSSLNKSSIVGSDMR
ncbi:MAG: HdeD family acid-resistance protein [Nitrososphaeraceae archaeon]